MVDVSAHVGTTTAPTATRRSTRRQDRTADRTGDRSAARRPATPFWSRRQLHLVDHQPGYGCSPRADLMVSAKCSRGRRRGSPAPRAGSDGRSPSDWRPRHDRRLGRALDGTALPRLPDEQGGCNRVLGHGARWSATPRRTCHSDRPGEVATPMQSEEHRAKQRMLDPKDVVLYAVTRPRDVCINEVQIVPGQ